MPERVLSDEETRKLGLDKPERALSDDEVKQLGLDEPMGGAQGGGGSDKATTPRYVEPERHQLGGLGDIARGWVNNITQGGAPTLEGLGAGYIQDAKNLLAGEPFHPKVTPREAMKAVQAQGIEDHEKSADTWAGKFAGGLGMLMTPGLPGPVKDASTWQRAKQAANIGGGVGAANAAFNSKADLTKPDLDNIKRFLVDTGEGYAGGAVTGGLLGGGAAAVEPVLRSTARKLPMDMLGVSTPARRSMMKQGIYDAAGDDMLKLVRPFRSGMHDKIQSRAEPFRAGSLQDKQVAGRMDKEAKNLLESIGSTDPEVGARISLAEAEKFKQRFGPQVAKEIRHAGEPAAKTTALAETYRGLKNANEEAARAVSPELADKFVKSKKAYSRLAAPLEGAGVDRAGMKSSDFDLGSMLNDAPAPGSFLSKLGELPGAGLVKVPLDLAGQAYGRGTAAKFAEFLANRAKNNTGGIVGGRAGGHGMQSLAHAKGTPWAKFLHPEDEGDE